MKKKATRLISAVLSAAMALTSIPFSAFAEGEVHTHSGTGEAITTPLDFREKTADDSGNGWNWEYDTKTLTLDGVNIQATTAGMSVVTVPDGTEIVLNGENTIVQTDTGDSYTYVLSAVKDEEVNCDGTMTISGDGVLNAENLSTDRMARSLGGTIIINGGTVKATGKVVAESLEIHNDGALNANASATSFDGAAVGVSRGITVDGNGSLTAVGSAVEDDNNGAILLTSNFGDKISVSGNGSITVPESNEARGGIYYSGNIGIDAEISGGKVTAYGTKCGIYKVNLTMSGTGSVYATGGSYGVGQTSLSMGEDEFVVKGSTEFKAEESTVTDDAEFNSGYYEIGGADAKTVVIKPDTEPSIKLGKQIGAVYAGEDNSPESMADFYITAKNFADGEFVPEVEWDYQPRGLDAYFDSSKTICSVFCEEATTSGEYTFRIKCGEVYSNTVTVTVGKPHFTIVSKDSQNKYYTNYNGEQKITLEYSIDAGYDITNGLQYDWNSSSKKYDIADLGTVTTADGATEFVFSDNVPEGNYVIYCDVVYNDDNGEAYTLTERFAFTFEECKHTGGFTDGICNNCKNPCGHSDINAEDGICKICGEVASVALYTGGDGTAMFVDADELHSLLNEYEGSGTIKLFKDYAKSGAYYVVNGELTIDLNGHNFKAKGIVSYGGKVTLKNGGAEQVRYSGSIAVTDDAPGGTLIIDGNIYFSSEIYTNDNKTVKLYDGTYSAGLTANGSKTVYDMLGEGKAFIKTDGTLFNANVKKVPSDETLTVGDHPTHTYNTDGECDCGYVCPHSDIDIDTGKCTECEYQYAAVIVKDGAVASVYKDTEMGAAFETADSADNKGCTLKVFNYTSDNTTLTELSGEFTLWLDAEVNVGTILVLGDITVTGLPENSNFTYGSFKVLSGGKLTFDKDCRLSGNVSVGAGTFDCYNSFGINLIMYNESSNVTLYGGWFTGISYNGEGDRENAEILTLLADNRMFMTRNGQLIDGSLTTLKNGFSYTVIVIDHQHTYDSATGKCACGKRCDHSDVDADTGVCGNCGYQLTAIISGVETPLYFDNIDAAFAAAVSEDNNGCTLTLYKDCELKAIAGIGNATVTVDVNGYTLGGGEAQIEVTDGGVLYLKDSRKNNNGINTNVVVNGGTLINGSANGSSSAVDINGLGVYSAKSVEIYGGRCGTLYIQNASGIALYGGIYSLINGDTNSTNTPVSALLAKGYAFVAPTIPPTLVDGSTTTIGGTLTNVVVTAHTHIYDETNTKCACGAVLYATVTAADGTVVKFDDIEEGLLYADKAENKGCVFTLVTDGELKNNITLSSGQFTIKAIGDAKTIKSKSITIDGADVSVEDCTFNNISVYVNSGTLKLPEGSNADFDVGISVRGGTFIVSDGVDEYCGANSLTISDDATDVNMSIGGGTYAELHLGQYKLKDVLASGTRLISYVYSQDTDEKTATNELYGAVSGESDFNADNTTYQFVKCDHKVGSDSYALDNGVCKYCNTEFAATVSYTADNGEKTELFADIFDAFAKANEVGTATITLQKNIEGTLSKAIEATGSDITLDLNGKRLRATYDSWHTVEVMSGKLTVKGDSILNYVTVYEGAEAVILGGIFSGLKVNDGGNAEISGGRFGSLSVSGEGRTIEDLLAEGYGYKDFNGNYWISVAKRETQGIADVVVRATPIKSASIAWHGEAPAVIYRNGNQGIYLDVTAVSDAKTEQRSYSDYVNDNVVSSNMYPGYLFGTLPDLGIDLQNNIWNLNVADSSVPDGEVEYYCIFKYNGYQYKSNVLKFTLATCSHENLTNEYGALTCDKCKSNIYASVETADGKITYHEDLSAAISKAEENDGSVLMLLDSALSGPYTINKGSFTVDFNGKTAFGVTQQFNINGGNIAFKSSEAQKNSNKFTVNVLGEDTNVTVGSGVYLQELIVESGKVTVEDNAIIKDGISVYGGETVIRTTETSIGLGNLKLKASETEYSVSIESGRFDSVKCEDDSNYTLGKALAKGTRVADDNGRYYEYNAIISAPELTNIFIVEKCNHLEGTAVNETVLDSSGRCRYCNNEYVATVYYYSGGADRIEFFENIYDAFDKANEKGVATVKLYKDIADSELTSNIIFKGDVTLELNGKNLGDTFSGIRIYIYNGGALTVNGDGRIPAYIYTNPGSEITVNSGYCYNIKAEGNVIICGGEIEMLSIYGDAEISGGTFKFLTIDNGGGTLESVLADGYAYYNESDKKWLTVAEREKNAINGVDVTVKEAPIKNASIAWAYEDTPVIYRNGAKGYNVDVIYELADDSKEITYSDIANGNTRKTNEALGYDFDNKCPCYSFLGADIGLHIAEDGPVEYYCILDCDGYEYKSNILNFTLATCLHQTRSEEGGIIKCDLCRFSLIAQVETADGDVTYYNDITQAVTAATENEGSTLTLISRNQTSNDVTISCGKFTVDLAGVPAQYTFEVTDGDITFKSSEEFSSDYSDRCNITVNGSDAKVTIDGKIELDAVQLSDGTFTTKAPRRLLTSCQYMTERLI